MPHRHFALCFSQPNLVLSPPLWCIHEKKMCAVFNREGAEVEVEGGCHVGKKAWRVSDVTRCSRVEKPAHFLPPPPPSFVLGSLINGAVLGTGRWGWAMHKDRVAALGAW